MEQEFNSLFEIIDLTNDDTKSHVWSLVPYIMSGDLFGLKARFQTLPPDLQEALVSLLMHTENKVSEILDAIAPDDQSKQYFQSEGDVIE